MSAANELRHVHRFYIRFASLPNGNCGLFSVGNVSAISAGNGPNVFFNSADSKIYAGVGTTQGASGVAVTTGVWYRIDFDGTINTGGNDTCDVQVDGTACGQATATGTSSGTGTLTFGVLGSVTADVFYDDVLSSFTGADYPLGGGYVNHFTATSDGTHNVAGADDFERGNTGTDITNATTTAFQLIDNVPLPSAADAADNIQATAPPNATDYVEIVFGPASGISTPTVAPRNVNAIVAHHQAATQSGNIRIALNDNGSTDDILNLTAAGVTTIRYAYKNYADPPSAASTWTLSGNGNFNNVRMRFFSSDAAPDQRWDAAMIEAEFQPPPPIATLVRTFTAVPSAAY